MVQRARTKRRGYSFSAFLPLAQPGGFRHSKRINRRRGGSGTKKQRHREPAYTVTKGWRNVTSALHKSVNGFTDFPHAGCRIRIQRFCPFLVITPLCWLRKKEETSFCRWSHSIGDRSTRSIGYMQKAGLTNAARCFIYNEYYLK